MKVSIFTDSFLPYISGVSCAVINQGNEMIRRGHEVDIFRPKPLARPHHSFDDLNPRVEVHDIPISIPNPRLPGLHIAIPSVISSYNKVHLSMPDVVHVHTEWGCGWEGVMIAKMMDVPVVGTFHTFFAEPEYLKHFYLPPLSATRTIMWKYSVFFYSQCETVISPSQSVKRELVRNGLKREPQVVSNGVHLPAPGDRESTRGERAARGLDGPTCIYVGRIGGEKSLDVVIDAFALALKNVPDARLVIIGSGSHEKEIDSQIANLHLQDRVKRLGFIPHDELIARQLLLLGDVFVTASTTENQPLSILEAMAYGLPFVGVRAKGIPELVEDGENGLLTEPGDVEAFAAAMERLLGDAALRKRMGEKSRQMARQHDMAEVGATLEKIYEATRATYMEKRDPGSRMSDAG